MNTPKNNFKRVLKIYGASIVLFCVTMIISTIIYVKIRIGDDPAFPKAVILVLIGSLFYALYFAITSTTQFIVVKKPSYHILAYFSPLILTLGLLIFNNVHNTSEFEIAIIFLTAQLFTTVISYWFYRKK
ncbi:hypothetical protein H2O64_02430 [Kordia sp. YSTF-M3]|uniref:Integral membrane protein n=1 Tax=Kordia aestuariivivens TaxID=2759037 RepID=A0ABR7Q4N5_9FLAO|nr:hypothetical protein [Kordia aestuariivivens]MBC8753510.1 hypothetical protein [Kordia aestuariivivens]